MIRILAVTEKGELLTEILPKRLKKPDIKWFWVDITEEGPEDLDLLETHFKFHHLAIEDCIHSNQRPKVDFYDGYNFFVLNSLDLSSLTASDLELFVGENYVVTFHKIELCEINSVFERVSSSEIARAEGHLYATYLIFDKVVDQYFPAVYKIEDALGNIVIRDRENVGHDIINRVFDLREDLIKLRRTVNSKKELLYRILNSEHLQKFRNGKRYFNDIYDHLLKLSDIVESNRELTADMRDSYLSINSHRMNKIMTVLTIITSIFIPLTFIVGVYGMNFEHMPELKWKNGYFLTWGIMLVIGVSMFVWFKVKGWFNVYK